MPCILFEEPFIIFPLISLVVLEKILQVLFGDDRKSKSGGCFSVLVILIFSS